MPDPVNSNLEALLLEIAGLALLAKPPEPDLSEIGVQLKAHAGEGFLDLAQKHGLGPLAYHLLKPISHEFEPGFRLTLHGLFLRQKAYCAAQTKALSQIAQEAAQRGLTLLILKGAALGPLIYAQPCLRPKGDLDILVSYDQLGTATGLLNQLGYRPRLDDGHVKAGPKHLPQTSLQVDGYRIVVELHHGLMHKKSRAGRAVNRFGRHAMDFEIDQHAPLGRTLSPEAMLCHLCSHLSEHSIFQIRLIWMLDIVLWAQKYMEQIDWSALGHAAPWVLNTLALLDMVWPLPDASKKRLGLGLARKLQPDLRHWPTPWRAARAKLGARRFINELFFPSQWWLRLHYGLGPAGSIWPQRCLIHPFKMAGAVMGRFQL